MDNKSNTIVLTGGGTAGHVMPNINLKNELAKHFNRIVYIASKNGIENTLVKKHTNYEIYNIDTIKLERKKFLKNILIPFKLSKAISDAKNLLKQINPCLVFSKGGYVGLPVVIAASKLKIPVICHESDITMGLANKLAKKYASVICTNFLLTAEKNGKKCVHTGTPLPLSPLTKVQAKEKLKIKTTKPILLVTGGSLGAQQINKFVFGNINELSKDYFVYHITGKNNLNKKIKNDSYMQIEFSNDMWTIFKCADYAISRAGANSIVELLSNQIKTIFIPLPKGISRGDQIENAKFLESQGVSTTILQENLEIKKVQNALEFLKNNSDLIKNNIKKQNFVDGTKNIIKIILDNKST